MAQFNLSDWIPMPFWLGPPLPQLFNIYWPFIQNPPVNPSFSNTGESQESAESTPIHLISETTTYDNTETVEFPDGFDSETLMPRKIVIHRSAKVSK